LVDRLRGLERSAATDGWYVVSAEGGETTLPRTTLRLEAVSGLETSLARQEVDLSKGDVDKVAGKLTFRFRPQEDRLLAGKRQPPRRQMPGEEAGESLPHPPAADG